MKQIYVLAAALALTAVTANAQENLIVNGGFENWTAENPENFTEVGTTVLYNDLLTKETTIVKSGTNSCRQESKPQGSTQYLEYSTLIPVEAGASYTISYWYLDNADNARTRLWSTWRGADGNLDSALQSAVQEQEYSTNSPEWVQKTVTVTAPAGAVEIRYQIRTYHNDGLGGGYIYFDDLSFVKNAPASLDDANIEGLRVFPNPLSDNTLNITTANNAELEVAIFDILGKQVVNAKTSNGTVDTANLSAGIYVVKVTEGGKTATKKLIKK